MDYVTTTGTPVLLGDRIGWGLEGTVYKVNSSPGFVAKIYTDQSSGQARRDRWDKLNAWINLIGKSLPLWYADDEIAVPTPVNILVPKGSDNPIGALLHEVPGTESLADYVDRLPISRIVQELRLFWAENIASLVARLHAKGVRVVDWNPSNFLMRSDGRIAIIDTDNFQLQVGGQLFRSTVARGEYIPPWRAVSQTPYPSGVTVTEQDDVWGLLMLVIHLLTGYHPFGRYDADVGLCVQQRAFVHSQSGPGTKHRIAQAAYSLLLPMPLLYSLLYGDIQNGRGESWTAEKIANLLNEHRRTVQWTRCSEGRHDVQTRNCLCVFCRLDSVG